MITAAKEIKCVVWDLDNTIWDGTLAESNNVELKPGIAEVIRTLDSRGILQSIASKNNFDDAMNKLKEFGLNEYFIYPEIHWNAKSSSIGRIQKSINIGIDTLLFIDDQAFERDEVKNIHSEVSCVDAKEYPDLLNAPGLNPKFITSDSSKRRMMYMADIERNKQEEKYEGPKESFLASLGMEFDISDAQEEDLKRAEELTVRTNQLNSTGVTYDYEELNDFRLSNKHKLYICELKDKYGSYGKIGLALVNITDEYWHLKLLLMSCRVMARGVGTVLMSYIMHKAKKDGKKLRADFKKTSKNRMMLVSYKFANFKEILSDADGNILFENDLSEIQDFPNYITIKINNKKGTL
jgi:FkbH-like protein